MQPPKNPAEYLELVDQAIFEVGDVMRCAEEEDDGIVEFASHLSVYRELEAELKKLHAEVAAGTHAFGGGKDLPLMAIARPRRSHIPFFILLGSLNTVHKEGF
jgi:hypothetical protein